MTDLDPRGELQLHSTAGHVIARMPLSGPVSADWQQHYQRLARATRVPARVEATEGWTWIVVRIPAAHSQSEVGRTLTAAFTLIADADAATVRGAATAQA